MSVGIGKGKAQGDYPGNILKKYAEEIKTKYLKGLSIENIFNSDKKKYKSNSSVEKIIASMKKGISPVVISEEEFSKRPTLKSKLIASYNKLTTELGRPPMQSELVIDAQSSTKGVQSELPKDLKLTPGQGKSSAKATAASVEAALNRKVDKPTPTYAGGKIKVIYKDAAQKAEYIKNLKLAMTFPSASSNNPRPASWFMEKYGMGQSDVERIHKILREEPGNGVPEKYPKGIDTSSNLERAKNLTKNSNRALEQQYQKSKKGIGSDFAHRESKKLFPVTTSNTGMDDPVINRIIIRPGEKDRNKLYKKINEIREKYLQKDGTYSKPSQADTIKIANYNKELKKIIKDSKGRLSGKIVNQFNFNTALKDIGIKQSLTIGGRKIKDVPLKDVPALDIADQDYLNRRVVTLAEREANRKPRAIFEEFENLFKNKNFIQKMQNQITSSQIGDNIKNKLQKIINIAKRNPKTAAGLLLSPFYSKIAPLFLGTSVDAAEVQRDAQGNVIESKQVIEKPETVQYNRETGSFLNTTTEDKTDQNQLLQWGQENPLTAVAGTSVALSANEVPRSYKMRRGVGDTGPLPGGKGKIRSAIGIGGALKPLLTTLGTPAIGLGFESLYGKQRLEEGDSVSDILLDPLGPAASLAFMEPLSKASGVVRGAPKRGLMGMFKNYTDLSNVGTAKPGLTSKALRLGMSPRMIAGASRFLGLPGLALTGGLAAYDAYKNYQNEEGMIYNLFNDE